MTLDEILHLWSGDSQVMPDMIGQSALDIAKLHHKYYSIYAREKLQLRKMEEEFKQYKRDKFEFYVTGGTQEDFDLGWRHPPGHAKLLKGDAKEYMSGDSDIIERNLKIAYQQEKVDCLDSIIKAIMNRGFHLKTALDHTKFQAGEL